jgi:hypothetical protein
MTHDELIAKIDSVFYEDEGGMQLDLAAFNNQYRAIRAVVGLHKPVQSYMFEDNACSHCSSEEDRVEILYPCQTIQAIEKELNGY